MKHWYGLGLVAALFFLGLQSSQAAAIGGSVQSVGELLAEDISANVLQAQFRGRRVIVRPPRIRKPRRVIRRWNIPRRRYFGTVIGGITLGTVIAVAIIGTAPKPPSPGLCWYWADDKRTHGYWYHCTGD